MRTSMSVNWWSYVQQVTAGESGEQIARRLEVSGATVSRWKTATPKPETVARFARVYGRPVLEAFVEAGFLTGVEANQPPPTRNTDPRRLTNGVLIAELARRLDGKIAEDAQEFPENAENGEEHPLGSPEEKTGSVLREQRRDGGGRNVRKPRRRGEK